MTPKSFLKTRVAVSLWGAVIVVLCIVAYSAYAAFPYFAGPQLTFEAKTSPNGITTLYGGTERVAFLEINGAPIPLEESGAYAQEFAFPPGYTALQATARDRFGHTITKNITFVNQNYFPAYGIEKEN